VLLEVIVSICIGMMPVMSCSIYSVKRDLLQCQKRPTTVSSIWSACVVVVVMLLLVFVLVLVCLLRDLCIVSMCCYVIVRVCIGISAQSVW
jgi:hypothetical protein